MIRTTKKAVLISIVVLGVLVTLGNHSLIEMNGLIIHKVEIDEKVRNPETMLDEVLDGSFIRKMNIQEGDEDFLHVRDVKPVAHNNDKGVETFKIELGLMNNKGYPKNVIKVIEIKTKYKDDIINYFKSIKRTNSSYIVTFQRNINSNEESYYLEVDENTYESRDSVLNVLNTVGNIYIVN